MNEFFAELIGTMVLIILGNGVVANTNLKGAYGNNGGWIVITLGWSMAVFTGVIIAGPYSGAHLNPAVTLGLALAGKFAWSKVALFITAQILGAMLGATIVWLFYRHHFNATENKGAILSCFATQPAFRKIPTNLFNEMVGTFILVFVVFYIDGASITCNQIPDMKIGLGSVGALPVAFIVLAIGLSLGGATGYAINPARDLGPRIIHSIAPIPNKGESDWSYSFVPIIGPLAGASIATLLYLMLS